MKLIGILALALTCSNAAAATYSAYDCTFSRATGKTPGEGIHVRVESPDWNNPVFHSLSDGAKFSLDYGSDADAFCINIRTPDPTVASYAIFEPGSRNMTLFAQAAGFGYQVSCSAVEP